MEALIRLEFLCPKCKGANQPYQPSKSNSIVCCNEVYDLPQTAMYKPNVVSHPKLVKSNYSFGK